MVAEAPHGLSLPGDTGTGGLVQFLGLDKGEGYISIEDIIVSEIDLFLAALAEEFLDLIAAAGEGGGLGRGLF
jgi:hypothetical protein